MQQIRIVQISDIHFSILNGAALADRIADCVNGLHPDLVVCTGDLIDNGLQDEERVIASLKRIKAPYGTYAVPGNHEFYTGIVKATDFTTRAGFRMLRNQSASVADCIHLIGVDDPAGLHLNAGSRLSEQELLRKAPSAKMNILLKHQPTWNTAGRDHLTLQLSGHVHKGQIFPFSLITVLLYRYSSGYFEVAPQTHLYVSRGTGTWGPPIRFLAPPEITVIEIKKR